MDNEKRLRFEVDAPADGTVEFTLPFEITVRMRGGAAAATDGARDFGFAGDELAPPSAAVAAVRLARRNRDRTPEEYYDAAADERDRTAYYSGVDASAGPAALFAALRGLLRSTHRTQLPYQPATHLYPDVDLHPDGKIVSIYSGQQMDPEELILADIETDRARRAALSAMSGIRLLSMDDAVVRADRIEAAFPYNCEHVVPQSWFAKRNPMKGDLHHLFACEIKCNSLRGNTPYFDFERDETTMHDCGQSEQGKFEPVGGKGAVARATLYFLVRYPGEINANAREYTADRIKVLLRWHEENPVSLYERHRNRTIAARQGNRNPFIDHPEWAGKVRLEDGLG